MTMDYHRGDGYVEITWKLMERFGVSVEHNNSWDRFYIRGGQNTSLLEMLLLKVMLQVPVTSWLVQQLLAGLSLSKDVEQAAYREM